MFFRLTRLVYQLGYGRQYPVCRSPW
jgi:hypothetical protein